MKALFKSNPKLFTLWYQLYRKNRGVKVDWFSQNTRLYFDGFPRSGNTFGIFLIKNLWPDLEVVHHFHTIAALKIALYREIPSFVLVRDPKNAISSLYLKYLVLRKNFETFDGQVDQALLRNFTKEYMHYYSWISKNYQKVALVDFSDLITYPEGVMARVNEKLPVEFQLSSSVLAGRVEEAKNKDFGANDKLGASRPTREKEFAKQALIPALMELPLFDTCQSIYQDLV